jgi:hypothetical protein
MLNLVLAAVWIGIAIAIGREFGRMARDKVTSVAPEAVKPIDDLFGSAGQPFLHVVASDCFRDEDPGDVLRLRALLADGSPLPTWLRFDTRRRSFTGVFPVELANELTVTVVASDVDGLEASISFRVRLAAPA